MPCTPVKLPGGQTAIVCSATRRCRSCGRRATLLCDWKVVGKRSGTCDEPLCDRCSYSPVPDKDLCLKHREAYEVWRAQRP